ncbi:AraC family transcriptional regulator [Alkalicoccobacillus plakortidis]|uniref:AraC family transcriptional regulator n=1 Tax=Alkalicoccobacillus plakortidis TaxID=444060 RepID=A0ABT0XJN8_9BACI|nr:AraC family transcriptional regulator [Alkalicoccobacillus plakortidis]MCM2676115.1 AraC family transcriptional regulator [Alkalicoccobacillus plakortidis]
MKRIQKAITPGQNLPISITYKDTKSQRNELPHHTHDWNEIIYVYKGKGTLLIDQNLYQVAPGDLFVIPGNVIHRALPSSEHLITSTAIFFSSSLTQLPDFLYAHSKHSIVNLARLEKTYRFQIQQSSIEELEHYLDKIHLEISEATADSERALFLWLQMLLAYLDRHCVINSTSFKSTSEPEWIRNLLLYIESHLDQKLELDELARRASISSAHLSRVFKKYLGIGLSEYITSKRMAKAKQQLLHSNENIETIAEACGFASMPHFYRTFKKHNEMTPTIYRKAGAFGE